MSIKIIADSPCDLPWEIVNEHGIEVVPLTVLFNDEEFLDGQSLKSKELLAGMRAGNVYKTSQVSPKVFYDCFLQHAEKGEKCIYIAFSSALSGTYNSSLIAKEEVLTKYPDFELEIIDSKCASMGLGLVVYKAALMVEQGKNKEEIVNSTKFNAQHMEHIFTVDDLEYLYRGGRVSRSAAFIGGILNIKPILNVEDGKLIPIDKVRGRQKSFKRIIELIKERGTDLSNQIIGISHGDDIESVNKIRRMMEQEFGCSKFIVNNIGCAVGAHSGPGTLSIFFLNEIE